MKTSNYFIYRGEGRISISRTVPKNVPVGYRRYDKLIPGAWIFDPATKLTREEYHARYYRETLTPLNPRITYNVLCALTAPHEPVLLCWEDITKPGEWCHRRIVAEWLEKEVGISVPEYTLEKPKNRAQLELI